MHDPVQPYEAINPETYDPLDPDADPTEPGIWHHHRNGVSGTPFRTRVAEGAVAIEFYGNYREVENPDTEDGWDEIIEMHPCLIPLSHLEELHPDDPIREIDCFGVDSYAWLLTTKGVHHQHNTGTPTEGTFLIAANPNMTGGLVPNAVLRVEQTLAGDVRFGSNSWRPEEFWHILHGHERLTDRIRNQTA